MSAREETEALSQTMREALAVLDEVHRKVGQIPVDHPDWSRRWRELIEDGVAGAEADQAMRSIRAAGRSAVEHLSKLLGDLEVIRCVADEMTEQINTNRAGRRQ